LDIPSRNVLEMALKQFQGTLCLITHDRHLINRLINKVIEIHEGVLHTFPGNYDYYLFKKEQRLIEEVQGGKIQLQGEATRKKSSYKSKGEKRRDAEQQDEYRRQRSLLKKRLQEVEQALSEATQQLEDLNRRLSDPSLYLHQKETYETVQTHKVTQERVKTLTESWEALALELEELKPPA
jgi:ATP-binding cassette, subfamily F, member 3